MTTLNSYFLYKGLKEILDHDNLDWHDQVKCVKKIIGDVLKACPQIEHTIVDGNLLFNYDGIQDAQIKDLLKCYRKIAVSTSYQDDVLYRRILPKVKSVVETMDTSFGEGDSRPPVSAPITTINAFLEDLRLARDTNNNRVIGLLNDRGYKCKYLQVNSYDFKKVAEIDRQYRPWVSIYKNWCLYKAYNSIYVIDRLLLNGLISVCNKEIDIIGDENECYASIMSCLILLDKFLLHNVQYEFRGIRQQVQFPSCITYLLELCIELMGVYMLCHGRNDMMRTAECHVNRARLNDRLYYHDLDKLLFSISVLRNGKFIPFDPVELKALYIYDMDAASRIMPIEFEENYDYRMSANMMHQHRQVAAVLPDGGDVFDTNYPEMVAIGKSISDAIKMNSASSLDDVLNVFGNSVLDIRKAISVLYQTNVRSISHYVYENERLGIKEHRKSRDLYERTLINMDNILCFSYTHQIESFAKYGMVKVPFIPIYFKLDLLIDRIKKSSGNENIYTKTIGKQKVFEEECVLTSITNITVYPDYDIDYYKARTERGIPLIRRIHALHNKDGNLMGIYCYGINLLCVKHKIDWSYLFFGIPVTVILLDDCQMPETMLLRVCFFMENDINYT